MPAHESAAMPAAGGSDIQLLIRLIRKCIREDREPEALRILCATGTISFSSGVEAVVWGRLAEMLGERELAGTAYALALADAAAAADALVALASMQVERGDEASATLLLELARVRGISPALEQGLAREIVQARAREPEFLPDIRADLQRKQALDRFLQLFRGRSGVYARQWYDRAKDLCGYAPIYEPFTRDVAEKHLAGSLTVGLYPLSSQGTVFFAAIDIDVAKSFLPRLKADQQYRRHIAAVFKNLIAQLYQWALPRGLETVFEDSGHKGVHGWFFFEEALPAVDAIALLESAVASLKGVPSDLHCEIFPKQEKLGAKTLGNLIKLPLGVHRKTGRKSRFLNFHGMPVADWQSRLLGIRLNGGLRFEALLEELRARRLGSKIKQLPAAGKAAQPTSTETPLEATGPAGIIACACGMLKYLAEKARREQHLSFAERKVLLGVLGHVPGGEELLHGIIGGCADYSRQITDHYISKLRGTPLGCGKIRRLLFYLEGSIVCRCALPASRWAYETPVAFAWPKENDTSGAAANATAGPDQKPAAPGNAVPSVLVCELQEKIRQLEAQLEQLLSVEHEAVELRTIPEVERRAEERG